LFYVSHELKVFDYISQEDLSELKEFTGKLNSLMLLVGRGDVEEEDVLDIHEYLHKIASILSTYNEVYAVSKALSLLSEDLSTNVAEFIANSESLGGMCDAFSKDISKWIEMSFYTGAPSVDFMNDTIIVNCQTISSMLRTDEQANEEEFDDIFDF
jgi:hypothetical protein